MTTGEQDHLVEHLVQAAEHLRRANHATYDAPRTVTDLYDVIGALVALVQRLPQQIDYLHQTLRHAEPSSYRHDTNADVGTVLAVATLTLADTRQHTAALLTALNEAWTGLAHLAEKG